MSTRRTLGWLALRLAFGRRDRLATSVVLGLATVLLTVVGLATAAAPYATSAQSQREAGRTAQLAETDQAISMARLLELSPDAWQSTRWWDGHPINRTIYAINRDGGEAIPGVPHAPAPGTYYASPDLLRLTHHDPVVRALFSGKRLAGQIAPAGLVQPHELRAVEGISPDAPLLEAVTGFGAHPTREAGTGMLNATVATATLVSIWAPALILLVIASRLASRSRARRARALRLQGLSIRAVRALMAAEVAVVALPGALAGVAGYLALSHLITTIPGTSFGFYHQDVQLPVPMTVLVIVLVVLAVMVSAAFSLPMEPDEPVAARRSSPRRTAILGMGMLTGGLVYLLVLPAVARLTPHAPLGIWVSIALILAGMAIAGPQLIMQGARWAAVRVRGGGSLVGLRLSSWTSTTAMRLGTLTGILIILLLGIVAFVNVLSGGSTQAWSSVVSRTPTATLTAYDLTGQLGREDVSAVARNHAVAEARILRASTAKGSTRRQNVVFATCRDLSDLLGRRVSGCTSGGDWLTTRPNGKVKDRRGQLHLSKTTSIDMPSSRHVVQVAGGPQSFDGAILLPPRQVAATGQPQDSAETVYFALIEGARLDVSLARLSGEAPTTQFDLGQLQWSWPGNQQYRAQYHWLGVGILAGLIMGALALLAATLGESTDRRRRLTGMRRLGAARKAMLSAHFWSTAMAPLLLGWAGTGVGWLICMALHQFDDRADVPSKLYLVVAGAVAVVALLIATVSASDTRPSEQNHT